MQKRHIILRSLLIEATPYSLTLSLTRLAHALTHTPDSLEGAPCFGLCLQSSMHSLFHTTLTHAHSPSHQTHPYTLTLSYARLALSPSLYLSLSHTHTRLTRECTLLWPLPSFNAACCGQSNVHSDVCVCVFVCVRQSNVHSQCE